MSNTTVTWICKELSRILELSATEDIAQYLMSMENSRDIEDYLQSMLDVSNPEHRRFVEGLLTRLGHAVIPVEKNIAAPKNNDIIFKGQPAKLQKDIPSNPQHSKKRVKQINLFSKEGQAKESITLPGQHRCECQASKHPLVRNCLECGRVICAQEGSGPCLFCVEKMTESEKEALLHVPAVPRSNKQTSKKFLDGTAPLPDKAFTTAMAHKEKLLEYDRTSEHRTRVIDDESDYFNADGNKWLNPKQRDALRSKEQELRESRHGSKRAIKVTLDFAGRQVIEEQNTYEELFNEQLFEEESKEYYDEYAVNPALTFPRPMYDSAFDDSTPQPTRSSKDATSNNKVRVQDAELQKMSDSGKCLSMHQPYASLLVAGIKKHEGRSWYSSHRGRLWIASTAKDSTPEEIRELENFYRAHYGNTDLVFPKNYPVGCLLGCVEVVDVLPQEEYRLQYPKGESESPYVFICENPHELFVKFPNKGQHKIYKLDSAVHQTAKKSLRF